MKTIITIITISFLALGAFVISNRPNTEEALEQPDYYVKNYSPDFTEAVGDTLKTIHVYGAFGLGVTYLSAQQLYIVSNGGTSSASLTDNVWQRYNLAGAKIDSFPQTGSTNGYGFRDLAFDGKYILASDNTTVNRIDTGTYTIVAPGTVNSSNNPHRGLAYNSDDSTIMSTNFTTGPLVKFKYGTGTTIRNYGTPTVAPYGIAFDKWSTAGKMWLWYAEPSATGQPYKLSKIDTLNGSISQTITVTQVAFATCISGGLEIVADHPEFPGRVVAIGLGQCTPNDKIIIIDLGTIVGAGNNQSGTPVNYMLAQNYPNPFNPVTTIKYAVPKAGFVTIKVYDITGNEVATLVNKNVEIGYHSVELNAENLASGVYFYKMTAGDKINTKKMVLVK